jgi:uncharacterized lipoprotein YbaY
MVLLGDHGVCVMKRSTTRRTALLVAAAAIAATVPVAAQAAEIRGAVTFESGVVIPEGHIDIYLEDPALQGNVRRRAEKTRIRSDGRSRTIAFSLPQPASSTGSPMLQIVARLERADGWLIARGSAQVVVGSPVNVTLSTVMY